jgi:type IV secretory pathway TraG/TraD family ATPase VirD4
VDPKGENATVTAARRGRGSQHCKGLGQSVKVLDPFKAAQVGDSLRGRFNPLDALDPASDESIDEAGRIADAVVVIHESNDPFWDESARSMVKGLLLHVLTAPEYEGRRNLVTVRKLIMRGDWEAVEALRDAGETDIPPAHGLLWTALANNRAFDDLIAGIGDSFTNMLLNSPKQFESVLQVANRNTEFIDSPPMQRCLEASDFQLSELKTLPEGLSVYLCLPQRYMSTHFRWLRMMIALTVTEMEKVRGQPVTGYPVLMLLDEFAGLKRMEVIEYAVAQIASYGVKLFFVLQSLEQLKAVYKDNWETFLANSGLKVFFNLEDHFSREYVSKLIGETEVIREVKSSSDSTSESESLSRSTSRSQSESRGRSSSSGTSENEGTNSSVSTGKSWGSNRSESRSQNYSYAQGWIFRNYDNQRIGDGRSQSTGHSVTESKGQSHGVSHGTSRSRTDGTSETLGTSTSETEGTTRGTSQSRTAGSSETIQKRALVTPDEIGQIFSRIDERADLAYPGLALVVISGARPVYLRRVNYYEDFQFMEMFEPHPDYPFVGPKELTVDASGLGKYLMYFGEKGFGLYIAEWKIAPGQMVAAGDPAALVSSDGKTCVTGVRVPRAGIVSVVQGGGSSRVPSGPLFSLRYFEDGAGMIEPFSEIAAWMERVRVSLKQQRREIVKSTSKIGAGMLAGTVLAALFCLVVWGDGAAALIGLLGVGAIIAVARPKGTKINEIDAELKKFFPEPGAIPQAAPQPPASGISVAAQVSRKLRPATALMILAGVVCCLLVAVIWGIAVARRPVPFAVGKIKVSHFAGLKPGDTAAHVASLYGPASAEFASTKFYVSKNMMVMYEDGIVKSVMLKSSGRDVVRSHAGDDALLNLFGHPESDVIALLGPPKRRDPADAGEYGLYWNFPMAGRPAGQLVSDTTDQTLLVGFDAGSRCELVSVNW